MIRLKEMRQKYNLKQAEFARKLGVSQQMVSLYETGKNEPDINTLQRIAEIFNCSIDYLLENKTATSYKNYTISTASTILAEKVEKLSKEQKSVLKNLIDLFLKEEGVLK